MRAHPWFQNINWDTLGTKEQTAPFVPDVRTIHGLWGVISRCTSLTSFLICTLFRSVCCKQSKKANFDASHELEELLLEDNPLKARQRKVQDINNLSAEMRQMEEQ